MTTVGNILAHRGDPTIGYNPHRFIELYGGELIPVSNYEPDPQTSRYDYYYNSRTNQLFKRIKIDGEAPIYYWRFAAS
jgi:hypothetical protein